MATDEEKRELIKGLTRTEKEYLFYFCQGKKDKEIADILDKYEKSIGTRKTNVYKALKIEVPNDEKEEYLRTNFCPLVSELIPNKEALKNQQKEKLRPLKTPENDLRPEQENEPEAQPQKRKRPAFVLFSILGAGVILVTLVVCSLFGSFIYNLLQPKATPATDITATQKANTLHPPSQTQEFTAVPASETPIIFTNTPSLTPTITNTPPPTNTPKPAPLFTDFSSGLPEWITLKSGELSFPGHLEALSAAKLEIGSDDWKNYSVEYHVTRHNAACMSIGNDGLAIYALDENHLLKLVWHYCRVAWLEVDGADETTLHYLDDRFGESGTPVTLRLKNNNGNFEFYINGNLHTEIFDDRYNQGKAYIYIGRGTVVENLKVTFE